MLIIVNKAFPYNNIKNMQNYTKYNIKNTQKHFFSINILHI